MISGQEIIKVCEMYIANGYYVKGSIPLAKEQKSRMSFPIPSDEEIYALIDSTVLGSCKTGLAVCTSGIIWKNDWATASRRNYLPWEELAKAQIGKIGSFDIQIGVGNTFGASGASMGRDIIVNLLNELQRQLNKPAKTTSVTTDDAIKPPPFEIWMLAIGGVQRGPFNIFDLKELVLQEGLQKDKCYVWKKGMGEWKLMSEVIDFEEIKADIPPPLPPL